MISAALIWLLAGLLTPASAIQIAGRDVVDQLKSHATLLPDVDETYSAAELFHHPELFSPYRADTSGAVPATWLRFELATDSGSTESWILSVKRRYFLKLDVHIQEPGQAPRRFASGIENYQPSRIFDQSLYYPLKIGPLEPTVVLLKVKTVQQSLDPLSLTLVSQARFDEQRARSNIFYGLFFGAMLAMLLYNLVLFLSLRNPGHGLYVIAIASTTLWAGLDSGFVDTIVPEALRRLGPKADLLLGLIALTATVRFFQRFVHTRAQAPSADRFLTGLFVTYLVVLLAISLVPLRLVAHATLFAQLIQFITWVSLLGIGIYCWGRGSRYALIFVAAWLALIIGTSARVLVSMEMLPRLPLAEYLPYLGAALEAMILALGLAEKIKHLQGERDMAIRDQLRAARLANLDPLTGIYNRRFLEQYLQELLYTPTGSLRTVAVILIDLDHFKAINDNYGHPVGDEVLKEFCQRSSTVLRKKDVLARVGGEEFCVALPDTPLVEAANIAGAMLESLREKAVRAGPAQVRVTASAGIVTAGPMPTPVQAILAAADEALYEAKRSGRDRYVVSKSRPRMVTATLDKKTA